MEASRLHRAFETGVPTKKDCKPAKHIVEPWRCNASTIGLMLDPTRNLGVPMRILSEHRVTRLLQAVATPLSIAAEQVVAYAGR